MARVAPRDIVNVLPHPEMIISHPLIRNPFTTYPQIQQPGDKNVHPTDRYCPARCGNFNPTGGLLICLGLILEPARGESLPSGQRRGPAAPGEDKVLSPDKILYHTSTTPTTRGGKRTPQIRYRPARCGNPNPPADLLFD